MQSMIYHIGEADIHIWSVNVVEFQGNLLTQIMMRFLKNRKKK